MAGWKPLDIAATAGLGKARAELRSWYENAADILERIHLTDRRASALQFNAADLDVATVIVTEPDKCLRVGFLAGDSYYDEPYFYVRMEPAPVNVTLPPTLLGGGRWHTIEWLGTVLPASRITADHADQESQVRDFLSSSIDTATRMMRR